MSIHTSRTYIDNWLAQRAASVPSRTALLADGVEISFAELEQLAVQTARRLAAQGVRRGAAVVLELPAGVEYVALLHAVMKLGAVVLPLNPRLAPAERQVAIDRAQPAIVIGEAGSLQGAEADLPLLGVHDLDAVYAQILTSGTSGASRPIGLTYGNFLWSAVGSAFSIGVDPGDRWLCCMPLFHVGGVSIVTRSAIYGTGIVMHDGFDVDRVAASLADDGVTIASLVTTQLKRLLEAGVDLSGPRALVIGGGPVPSDILEEALGRGAAVVQTYGLTEACSQVTILAPSEAREHLGSSGRPLLTTHLRISDGEILVQGPTVAPGAADEDGWLHTGDLGAIDAEGFLRVTGRLGEVIVSGGENISPEEVEDALASHPDVADVAVIGRPDPEWQEAVTAVVVIREGACSGAEELRAHAATMLASYKLPKRFEFTSELPRTASGKLQRGRLREEDRR